MKVREHSLLDLKPKYRQTRLYGNIVWQSYPKEEYYFFLEAKRVEGKVIIPYVFYENRKPKEDISYWTEENYNKIVIPILSTLKSE